MEPDSDQARNSGRLLSLDIFRGVCAGLVFLTHWHLWSNFPPAGVLERFLHEWASQAYALFCAVAWNTGGHHPAVTAFFVLSGFCIYSSRLAKPGASWPAYFAHRARRILPVYWCGCLLGLAFVALQIQRPAADTLLEYQANATWLDAALRLSGLTALYPREYHSIGNGTIITVCTELAVYALFPVFLAALNAGLRWWLLVALLLASQVAGVAMLPYLPPEWIYNTPLMMGTYWYFGAAAAFLHQRRGLAVGWLPLAASAAVFAVARELPHFWGRNLLSQIAWGGFCTCLLLFMVQREDRFRRAGGNPIVGLLKRAGTVSYSLYAVHSPLIFLISWTLAVVFGVRSFGLQMGTTLVACLGGATLVYLQVERRFVRRQPKPRSAGVACAPPLRASP